MSQKEFSHFNFPVENVSKRTSSLDLLTEVIADDSVRYMRSQKSKAQLVYNGYIYGKKVTYSNGNTNWRCAEYLKYKCFASCITKNNRVVRCRATHKHARPTAKVEKKLLYFTEDQVPFD